MLRYIGAVVVGLAVLSGCGTDDPGSAITPTQSSTAVPSVPASPLQSPDPLPPTQAPEPQPEPEPVQIVPEVSPGESVELEIPPFSEQPAPGTTTVPQNPEGLGEITCETVCTSTGCEQYKYSVLGCR